MGKYILEGSSELVHVEVWVTDSLVQETLQVGAVLSERRQENPYHPHPSA